MGKKEAGRPARLLLILAASFCGFCLTTIRQKLLRPNGSLRMLPPHITMMRTTSARAECCRTPPASAHQIHYDKQSDFIETGPRAHGRENTRNRRCPAISEVWLSLNCSNEAYEQSSSMIYRMDISRHFRFGRLTSAIVADHALLDGIFTETPTPSLMHFAHLLKPANPCSARRKKLFSQQYRDTLTLLEALLAHGVQRFVILFDRRPLWRSGKKHPSKKTLPLQPPQRLR